MRTGPLTPLLAFACVAILMLAALFPLPPSAPIIRGVGIQLAATANGQLRWLLAYPADADFEHTRIGAHEVMGAVGARPLAGRFPLILIAPRTGGDMLDHHMTAGYLALSGFVVALAGTGSPQGDAHQDAVRHRVTETGALLDAILDSEFGEMIDRDRLGLIGHREGAEVALALAEGAGAGTQQACASALVAGCAPRAGQSAPFRAVFLLDPALPLPASIRHRPDLAMGVIAAGTDRFRLAAARADDLARQPSAMLVDFATNPRALLAPCSGDAAADATAICDGYRLADLQQEHALLNWLIASAFTRALGN